jgi:heat shock protein HslJ
MERPPRIVGLAFAAATLLSACSSAASPSAPGAAAPTVDGRTYLSTGIQGATLVPGTRVTLSFKDGNLNASGGCNSMSGPYTITGGHLSATRMAMTEMGCDQPRMRQDDWLARLLGDATITLAGDNLTLDAGGVGLTFRATP